MQHLARGWPHTPVRPSGDSARLVMSPSWPDGPSSVVLYAKNRRLLRRMLCTTATAATMYTTSPFAFRTQLCLANAASSIC